MAEATLTPPAPAAEPSTSTERLPSEWLGDVANDFADLDTGKTSAPPPKEAPKPEEKVKAPAKAAEKPAAETKPAEETVKPAEVEPKPAAVETPKPVKAAELRTAYEGLKKRVKEEYEPQLQSLKAKLQELEKRKPDESEPILAKVKQLETENTELQRKLAFAEFTEDPGYKKAHQEYADAWQDAVADFSELVVRKTDETTEEVTTRPATADDLLKLANMSLADMDAAATEMFGPSAPRAIAHLQNIRRLSVAQHKAEKAAKDHALEYKAKRKLEEETIRKTMSSTWAEVNKSLQEKFPKAFAVEENDPDDKSSHTKGFALADLMFLGGEALTPEQIESLPNGLRETVKAKQRLSPAQQVQLHAVARLKMANHDRKVAALKKATARIAELEKALAEYEKSEPDAGSAGTSPKTPELSPEEQIAAEIKAMDK